MNIRHELLFIIFLMSSVIHAQNDSIQNVEPKVKWMTWEEAVTAQKLAPRKIYVSVFTNWCVWCKKMDITTYQDSSVAAILNEEFYPVKLDAEMKDTMNYRGFTFVSRQDGDKGYHEFASSLLNGQMSYPALIILDENERRINMMKGYRNAQVLQGTLSYFADNGHLRDQSQQFGVGYNFKCANPNHRHGQTTATPEVKISVKEQ